MMYDNNCTLPKEYLELIQENGLEGLSVMIRLLVNQAMQFEREIFLNSKVTT